MNDNFHEMVFEKTHLSGVEEWYCPSCGRRFLVQWPPAYKMIVLEAGEKDTRHNLSKINSRPGGLHSSRTQQTQQPEPIEEFRLIPFLEWMEKVDFASRWDKND